MKWTSSVKTPGDFGIALVGFILLTGWPPPLVVVIVRALGGMVVAVLSAGPGAAVYNPFVNP